MPSYKYHIFVSLIAISIFTIILLYYKRILPQDSLIVYLFLPVIIFYAILPDIDSDTSIVTKIVKFFLTSAIIYTIIMMFFNYNIEYVIVMSSAIILMIMIALLRHRGFIHSITFAILFASPILFINKYLALFCFLAYISHLIIDGEMKLL